MSSYLSPALSKAIIISLVGTDVWSEEYTEKGFLTLTFSSSTREAFFECCVQNYKDSHLGRFDFGPLFPIYRKMLE